MSTRQLDSYVMTEFWAALLNDEIGLIRAISPVDQNKSTHIR